MRLENRVAIVTGGSQGIGAAIALRYAREGAKVAIVYHRNDANANAVADQIRAGGGSAACIKADSSKLPDIERMAAEALRMFGRVDILVNNAAIFRTVSAEDTTKAIWDSS